MPKNITLLQMQDPCLEVIVVLIILNTSLRRISEHIKAYSIILCPGSETRPSRLALGLD